MAIKWSPILHWISFIAAMLGIAAFLMASIAALTGNLIIGLSEEHLFKDTTSFFLMSIAFGLGTIIHMQLED